MRTVQSQTELMSSDEKLEFLIKHMSENDLLSEKMGSEVVDMRSTIEKMRSTIEDMSSTIEDMSSTIEDMSSRLVPLEKIHRRVPIEGLRNKVFRN